jgi:hypothetical protein
MPNKTSADSLVTIWLWLFPALYLLHIAEEYWGGGGYSAYVARTNGVNLSSTKFLVLNGIGWALATVGVCLARRLGFSQWLLTCLVTVAFVNGLTHTITAVSRVEYNPGLVSGLLIFIPLGAAILIYLKRRMRGRRYFGAVLAGAAIHAVISLLALSGGHISTPLR